MRMTTGALVFDLWIDHEGLNGAIAVLESHVLMVAGRCIQAGFRPVLRVDGSRCHRKKHSSGSKFECIRGNENCHGEEFSH